MPNTGDVEHYDVSADYWGGLIRIHLKYYVNGEIKRDETQFLCPCCYAHEGRHFNGTFGTSKSQD